MNSRITRIILSVALIGFSFDKAVAQDTGRLSAANNGFAFDLLKQIAMEQPGTNIFISPFSVSTALQMVGNGAAGETKAEMQRVLKTDGFETTELNEACRRVNQSLNSQSDVALNLADGIWYQKGIHLKSSFITHSEYFFGADPAAIDFKKPQSAKIINDWVEEKTQGKIKDLFSFPFPPLTRMILANAIYFKGKWAEPFDKKRTKPRAYYLTDGEMKQTSMMWQSREFAYQETNDFQAVRLAYTGNRLQMYLFLPTTNSSPQKLLVDFTGGNWRDKIVPQFSMRQGTLIFPKFKMDYELQLNAPLRDLGLKRIFDGNTADFSEMADEPLFVSEIKQKSFVEVNETGTEAAAVTGVRVTMLADRMEPPKPFSMIVDHPFLFVIADGQTQSILFTGIIFDPTN
ncbi:MAG TPA: serpin family protein [Verrucomicrobiae bacterium]|jgi:serpin B